MKTILTTTALIGALTLSASAHICDSINCERKADQLITQDARSWFWNRYDRGSASLVTTYSRKNGRL